MKPKPVAIFLVVVMAAAARPGPLPDGFPIEGFDGRLAAPDEKAGEKSWFFEFDSALVCGKDRIEEGRKLEILPTAALQKMAAEFEGHPGGYYRIWGRLTRYSAENYLLVVHFLPISRAEPQKQDAARVNEPNDSFAIPDEIVARLGTRPVVRAEQLRKGLELEQDSVLAGNSGRIFSRGECFYFRPDGLGRNIETVELELLPCQALAGAIRAAAGELETPRFTVSGLISSFKGRLYLLLERAVETYSYGNFAATQ